MPTLSLYPTFDIDISSDKYDITSDIINNKRILLPPKIDGLFWLPIDSAQILTSGDDVHKVIEITLNNQSSSFDYQAGDTIGILPENNIAEVDLLLQRINATLYSDCKYTLIHNVKDNVKIPSHLPTTGTLKYVFQHFIDIRRVLSKRAILALCPYTNDPIEKRDLENICNQKGLYSERILNQNLNILDILKLYPSCQPPVVLLLQQLPQLMPRPYSICNSPKLSKNIMKICFSVVQHDSGRRGLTTGMLDKLSNEINRVNHSNSTGLIMESVEKLCKNLERIQFNKSENGNIGVPAFFKPSIFRLPIDHSTPLIMICNGTGIAPFMGFLEERQYLKRENVHVNFGLSRLYFGCRYPDRDFLYKDKLNEFINDGTLSELVMAYSRHNDRQYVQDKLSSDTDLLSNLIGESAVIYVCGSNKMAKQVELYFINLLKDANNIPESDAKALVKNMKLKGKYIQDIWL